MLTGAIVGGFMTSSILSAISVSCVTDNVAEIASTILIDGGRRCKNSCQIMTLSSTGPESPRSCCICRNSCDGLQSPNSSAVSVAEVGAVLRLQCIGLVGLLED